MLSGPETAARSGNTQQLVVFLHGLGSDGNDLISLAPLFAEALPDAHFISPNAPEPCDMAPYGYQWFSLQNRAPDALEAGAKRAAPLLNAFLDAQLTRFSLEPDALALVGFSQGTMMSLYTALRRPEPIAGVLGYSGALVASDALDSELTARPPVCLIHGTADMVVPFDAMEHAESLLQVHEVPVEAYGRPGLPHSIDEEGIALGIGFLMRQFGV